MKILVILSLITQINSTMATEVNLRVFGSQDNNSMITLCPHDRFILVAECTVLKSSTLTWSLQPLVNSNVRITVLSTLGESQQEGVMFVLAKKSLGDTTSENSYISQVHIHTDDIREYIIIRNSKKEFNIRCQAETSTNVAVINLKLAAGDAPNITSGNREANMLSVTWSINMTGITSFAVIANNTVNGLQSCIVVGAAKKKASLLVNHPDPHNVTVTVFDQCQQNFTSEEFHIEGLPVDELIPQYTRTTSTLFLSRSPSLKQQCRAEEVEKRGLVAACAVLSTFVALLVCVLLACVLIIWSLAKKQETKDRRMKDTNEKLAMEDVHVSKYEN